MNRSAQVLVKRSIWILLLFLLGNPCSFVFALTPQEILEKTDTARAPFESFVMDVALKSPGEDMKFKVFSRRGEDSLVLYMHPASEKGKLLLMKEEDLWLFIPGTRRALRITPMQKLMGGISNGDISRLRWSMDYNAKLISQDENKYDLELTASKKSATYHRLLISIEKETFKPLKAKVYLKSGKLCKTIYFTGFHTYSDRAMATELKFTDHLRNDEVSSMVFSNVRGRELPDSYFNTASLPRLSETLSEK